VPHEEEEVLMVVVVVAVVVVVVTCKGNVTDISVLVFCTVHLIEVQKFNNIPDILHLHLDNSIVKCRKVMLLTVSDQIIIILICK